MRLIGGAGVATGAGAGIGARGAVGGLSCSGRRRLEKGGSGGERSFQSWRMWFCGVLGVSLAYASFVPASPPRASPHQHRPASLVDCTGERLTR